MHTGLGLKSEGHVHSVLGEDRKVLWTDGVYRSTYQHSCGLMGGPVKFAKFDISINIFRVEELYWLSEDGEYIKCVS